MGRISYSAVLGLLFLQLAYAAKPVFDAGHQWVYEYNSNILTKNAASDEHIAEWNVSGKLKIQSAKDQVIMKLDDLKTSVFNGVRANRQDAKEQKIPAEAQVLAEPFVVHYAMDDGTESHKEIQLSHQPDEPLWSVNMKRAIASIFQIKEDDKFDEEHKTYEPTIFGACQVAYKVKTLKDKKTIEKTLDYETCYNVSSLDWTNVKSYGAHTAIQGEMERVYHFTKKNGQFVIGDVESSANYTYRNMPDVRSSMHILQKQVFKLLEQTDIVDAIDTSKNTEKTTVLFEYPAETDASFGRNPKARTQFELIEEFMPLFDEFKMQLQKIPLQNYDIHENDTIDQMYTILSEMNETSLNSLTESVFTGDNEDDQLMQHLFLSILPYVGDATNNLILDLIAKRKINRVFMFQMLTIFPKYCSPSEELVKRMEVLMDISVDSPTLKSSALMSFATLVTYNYEQGAVSHKMLTDYQNKYMQLYRSKHKYPERLSYLLGLINLANGDDKLTLDYIIPIACDTNETNYLREMAMHSFAKLSFAESSKDQLYKIIWPMVRNISEPFEVRIAALEMILSNLHLISKKHFNNIIDSYTEYQTDPQDRHIQNYIYTKHVTLLNEPYYKEFITDATTIKMKSLKKHKSVAAWTTGNYRMGYTDEANNFGDSLHTKFVANPISNAVNVAEFSYRGHAMSLDLGTYTIYLKFDALLEKAFGKLYLDSRKNDYEAILELMELIAKNGYKLKDADVHMEFAVFVDNRAILGMYLENKPYINDLLVNDLKRLYEGYSSVFWPVWQVNSLISDLGTPIEISNQVLDAILINKTKDYDDSTGEDNSIIFYYRHVWTNSMVLSSYNPITDLSITTYKVINEEKQIQLPYRVHKKSYVYLWQPENDTFSMVTDHLIGTYADKEMVQYCANCLPHNELPIGEFETVDLKLLPFEVATGITFNVTRAKSKDDKLNLNQLQYVFDQHRADSDTLLLAKPLLYCWHYANYLTWLSNDVHRISLRSLPYYKEPTVHTVNFTITENSYYENDPFETSQFDISLALTNRKVANAEQISYLNASYQFVNKPKTSEDSTKSHIADTHFAQVELTGTKTFKMCVNREISYPDRRTNKYSIAPVEPATGNTKISWGVPNKNSGICPMDKYIKISEMYSATDGHNQKVRDTKEYKTCEQESKGLKYTPPTEACLAVFEMMSEYDLYKFYGDFKHAGKFAQPVADLEQTEHGLKLLEIERHLDDSINFTYSKDFVKQFFDGDKHIIVSKESLSNVFELFDVNPSDESYDDHVIKYGISNNCFITPNNIKTFTGKSIPNYETVYGKDLVALIECTDNTRAGVTVQRLNDKKIGFTLISEGNEIIATVVDDKLKVTFNGTDIERRNKYNNEDIYRTYFLDDNTIFVIDNLIELLYNTEYLLIKTFSVYNKYTCGACTYQKE